MKDLHNKSRACTIKEKEYKEENLSWDNKKEVEMVTKKQLDALKKGREALRKKRGELKKKSKEKKEDYPLLRKYLLGK